MQGVCDTADAILVAGQQAAAHLAVLHPVAARRQEDVHPVAVCPVVVLMAGALRVGDARAWSLLRALAVTHRAMGALRALPDAPRASPDATHPERLWAARLGPRAVCVHRLKDEHRRTGAKSRHARRGGQRHHRD